MSQDIDERLWMKLIVNAVINSLTAIHNVTNGTLLEDSNLLQTGERIATEAVDVALRKGIRFENILAKARMNEGDLFQESDESKKQVIHQYVMEYVKTVARRTAKNRSSMLCDLDMGRRTEIDFINGYIVKEGSTLGIDVNMNELICREVKTREKVKQQH